jgi:hypothetical protein
VGAGADDGLTYRQVTTAAGKAEESLPLGGVTGRYVAVQAPRWEGNTGLTEIAVFPAG